MLFSTFAVNMTEFGLIESIKALFGSIPTSGFEGIGDDCSVLPIGNGEALLFSTDMLVEDVHFLRAAATPYEVGRKSLAVNLSDVAAMGAKPVATLLSVALPSDATSEWIEEFTRGYHSLSDEWQVALVGGDTTASKAGITINVVAIGRAPMHCIKRRSAATIGDTILCNGMLGDSAAGLQDILSGKTATEAAQIHKNPTPQIAEGIWLGQRCEVHAMMDISDGVASDIRHIMQQSAVGADIRIESIPTKVDIRTAVCGGEDYKLLLTADTAKVEELCRDYYKHFGSKLYAIGNITDTKDLRWLNNGHAEFNDWCGFRHY